MDKLLMLQIAVIIIQGVGLFITMGKEHVKTREEIATLKTMMTRCPHVNTQDKVSLVHRAADT